jgi:dTDP-4-dehydrorhamnose reductase
MQPKKRNMLITGASGMLGNNLAFYFREKYNVIGLYHEHPVVISGVQTKKAEIFSRDFKEIVISFKPEVLVHCIALSNVDVCEVDHKSTDKLNILGTRVVVDSLKNHETKLLYISSDSVYSGGKGNFSEDDAVDPQNYYGLTKYQGELEALKHSNSMIVRTNFFGWNIQNKHGIAEWVLHELSNHREIRGFKDVFFSSIYSFDLAEILDIAIDTDLTGIFNFGSSESLSKYEFAIEIADRFGLDRSLIKAISIDDFDLKAKRGKNMSLNIDKLTKATNQVLPSTSESINHFYRDYREGLRGKIQHSNV